MRLGTAGVIRGAGKARLLLVALLVLAGCNGQVDASRGNGEAGEGDDSSDDGGGSGDAGSGAAAEIPDGCEDVLVHREELPECGMGCSVIEETPERVVQWRLSVESNDGVIDDAFWQRVDCVERQLGALGVAFESSGGDVVVVTGYVEIASVIHTTAIESIEATCPGGECTCADHDEAACAADPLCVPVSGQRLDTGSACPVFVECVRYDLFCVSFTPALDEAGACWRFASGCVLEGFTSLLPEGTEGCTDADFEALTPCSD